MASHRDKRSSTPHYRDICDTLDGLMDQMSKIIDNEDLAAQDKAKALKAQNQAFQQSSRQLEGHLRGVGAIAEVKQAKEQRFDICLRNFEEMGRLNDALRADGEDEFSNYDPRDAESLRSLVQVRNYSTLGAHPTPHHADIEQTVNSLSRRSSTKPSRPPPLTPAEQEQPLLPTTGPLLATAHHGLPSALLEPRPRPPSPL